MPLLVLDVLRHDVEQPGDALALQTAHHIQLDSTAQWAAAPVAVIRFAGRAGRADAGLPPPGASGRQAPRSWPGSPCSQSSPALPA